MTQKNLERTPSLASLDARIERSIEGPLSLDPRARRATLLVTLAESLVARARAPEAFVNGLARVAESQVEHFPGNIFWDFDAFAAHLATLAEDELEETVRISNELMARFGMRSPIRFRYVHDFMYGFDWARWVKRRPEVRKHVPPFGLAFLRYTHERGAELLALIAEDDEKYPRLDEDVVARNPFGFLREPREETRLLRHLAEQGCVPVRAWALEPEAAWEGQFSERREEVARALGLVASGSASEG
jgi:hypothetical protein